MLTKPGETTRDFIEGKRKNHQGPVSYFLIWVTAYLLFLYLLENLFGENVVINYKEYFGPSATTRFAISHLSMVLTVIIPFQALYLYLIATKKMYNYSETLVVTIYAIGTIILLQIVFSVLALGIYSITAASVNLQVSDIFKVIYIVWFIINLVRLSPEKHKLFRVVILCILFFATFTVWRLYGFAGLSGLLLPGK